MYFADVIRHGKQYANEWKALKKEMMSPQGLVHFDNVDTYLTEKSKRLGQPGDQTTQRVLCLKKRKDGTYRVALKAPGFWTRKDNPRHRKATSAELGFFQATRQTAEDLIRKAEGKQVDPNLIEAAQGALNALNIAWHANTQKHIDTPDYRQHNAALAKLWRAVELAP